MPFIRSINIHVDAVEIAHPTPKKEAAFIIPSSACNKRVKSSPQFGLCPVIDEVFKKFEKPTEGDLQDKLNNATKDDQQKSINDFVKQIIDSVRKQLTEKLSEGAEGSGGKGKKSAGSWLQAIAKAMGEAMGNRASKMVELSNKMADASKKEGQEGAKEMQSISTQFQAVSQEFNQQIGRAHV